MTDGTPMMSPTDVDSSFSKMFDGMPKHVQHSLLQLIDYTKLARESKTSAKRDYYNRKVIKHRKVIQRQIRDLDKMIKTHAAPLPFGAQLEPTTTPPQPCAVPYGEVTFNA